MRFSWTVSLIGLGLFGLALPGLGSARGTPIDVSSDGLDLDLVPRPCWTPTREQVPVSDLLAFRNKTVTVKVDGISVQARISGDTVWLTYGDEKQPSFIRIPAIIPYKAADIRLFHVAVSGKPLILWEETVENFPSRAGLIEYRGKGLFSVCEGFAHRERRQPIP